MRKFELMGIRTVEDAASVFAVETSRNRGVATDLTLAFVSCGARISHQKALELVSEYGLVPTREGFEAAIKKYYSKRSSN